MFAACTVFVASFTATLDGPLLTVRESVTVLVSPKRAYRCAGVGRLVLGCAPAGLIVRRLTSKPQLG